MKTETQKGSPTRDPEIIAAQLLEAAKAAGAVAADVVISAGASLGVTARAGALEEVERAEALDFGLRCLTPADDGWRQATVSASDPAPAALRDMAARAVAMAAEAPADPHGGLSDPAARISEPDAAAAALHLVDSSDAPTPEDLLETALALEAAALAVAGVSQAEGASASFSDGELLLATSDGFLGRYGSRSRSISVAAIAGDDVAMERDYAFSAARAGSNLRSVEAVGREAGERAVKRLNPRRAKKGAFPVMMEPRVAASIVSGVASALNGTAVARGASFLAERMGERILPAGLHLIDDPTLVAGLGSRPFDGEGLASRRKMLISNGVVSEWLLDCGAARKLGLASNGSAARGVGGPPSPASANIWLSAGKETPATLMGKMGEGLLITEMMGRGLNPVTGDYSRGAQGYWIENGQIAYPVSELTVAGDILEMLSGLQAADDLRFDRRVASPSLVMEGLTLGSA